MIQILSSFFFFSFSSISFFSNNIKVTKQVPQPACSFLSSLLFIFHFSDIPYALPSAHRQNVGSFRFPRMYIVSSAVLKFQLWNREPQPIVHIEDFLNSEFIKPKRKAACLSAILKIVLGTTKGIWTVLHTQPTNFLKENIE